MSPLRPPRESGSMRRRSTAVAIAALVAFSPALVAFSPALAASPAPAAEEAAVPETGPAQTTPAPDPAVDAPTPAAEPGAEVGAEEPNAAPVEPTDATTDVPNGTQPAEGGAPEEGAGQENQVNSGDSGEIAPEYVYAFPVESADFPATVLEAGTQIFAYFDGVVSQTHVMGDFLCIAQYKNGVSYFNTGSDRLEDAPSYDFLTQQYGFVEGDTYTVAFYDRSTPNTTCAATPPLTQEGLVQASLIVGAPAAAFVPCEVNCPTVTAAPVKVTQGVAVDMLVPFEAIGAWDWSHGGWIAAGPQMGDEGMINPLAGLNFEYQSAAPGAVPQLRLHGTPVYNGTFETALFLGNGVDQSAFASLTIAIAPAGKSGAITLGLAAGQPVAGAIAEVVASGLKPGAAYSVTVRSTPVVVASGAIDPSGVLARTVIIPAGLEAGNHSITLASTLADGSAFTSVLWFTVSASGTLVSVSATQPAVTLASTGAEATPVASIATSLFAAGILLIAAGQRRRKGALQL
jgi:hypothetical protein